jgi:hypothetical protein
LGEEIEALVAMVVDFFGFSQTVEFCDADFWGSDLRDELEIAPVGGQRSFLQRGQAVDGFLHGDPAHGNRTIPMMYLTVLLEKRDLIDSGLNAQHEVELVVHLDPLTVYSVCNECRKLKASTYMWHRHG